MDKKFPRSHSNSAYNDKACIILECSEFIFERFIEKFVMYYFCILVDLTPNSYIIRGLFPKKVDKRHVPLRTH